MARISPRFSRRDGPHAAGARTGQAQDGAPPDQARRGGFDQKFTSALEDQGISGDTLSSLRQKIDSAVQQAKSDSNDPSAVRSAVDGVLKDAGVDLDKLHEELAPPAGADRTKPASGVRAALQSAGIDPSTFKSQLSSLLDSGSTDTSSLFSGASTGNEVDVLA